MVATRKTTNKLDTSYSQMPAQDIWQREAEAETASGEEEEEEEEASFPPLSMSDGNHIRIQFGTTSEATDMPPLLNQNQTDDDDDGEIQFLCERDPDYRANCYSDNPSQLMPEDDDDFHGPPPTPTPPPTPPPLNFGYSQRTEEVAGVLAGFANAKSSRDEPVAEEPNDGSIVQQSSFEAWSNRQLYGAPVQDPNLLQEPSTNVNNGAMLQHGPPVRMPSINPYKKVHKKQPSQPSSRNQPKSNDDDPAYDSVILDRIATSLNSKEAGNEDMDFNEWEWKIIENCERGGNTKEYMDTQVRLEKRAFDTIRTYGGTSLQPFLQIVQATYDPTGATRDFAFYNILGGPKTPQKLAIINKLCILFGMKWKKNSGKAGTVGKPLQPNSICKYFQQLFYVWQRKGIQADFTADFNDRGQFHGIMIDLWKKIRTEDPTFGTNPNRKRVTTDYLNMVIAAIESGELDPENNPHDLLKVVIFILGYYCALRGKSEHCNLHREDFVVGFYKTEDGAELAGLQYCGVRVPFSKMQQLKLTSTSLPEDANILLTVTEDPNHPTWNPTYYLIKYFEACHPDAQKFYCKVGGCKQIRDWSEKYGKDIWYGPSMFTGKDFPGASHANNVGKNKFPELCKDMAKVCGVENWVDVTGHALRALYISTQIDAGVSASAVAHGCRQKNIKSQHHYNTGSRKQKAARSNALAPKVNLLSNKKPKVEEEIHMMGQDVKPASLPTAALPSILSPGSETIRKLEQEKKRLLLEKEIADLRGSLGTGIQPSFQQDYRPPPQRRHSYGEYHQYDDPTEAYHRFLRQSYGHGPPPRAPDYHRVPRFDERRDDFYYNQPRPPPPPPQPRHQYGDYGDYQEEDRTSRYRQQS